MTERVLLVGGGGREHAIARAIVGSNHEVELHACAGTRNPGIVGVAAGYETLDEADPGAVVAFARDVEATLAVVGPEAPLEAGVVDALEDAGVYAFGPRAADARIETDKVFQREFMEAHFIPGCPAFEVFTDGDAACEYLDRVEGDVAVKPRGLTGGKGVRVTGEQITKAEAKAYIEESEYEGWVIEERLVGEEFTVQAFVANGTIRATPAVQDHKRAFEGDAGPNTGGMGSYADARNELPFMTEAEYNRAVNILRATMESLPQFKGVIYGQFMLTETGPKVVEYNARFGDPEAMNTLPVMDTDIMDVLVAAREGEPLPDLSFAPMATVCKYAVPAGYPTDPEGGVRVQIDPERVGEAILYYASVDERPDGLYTTTSRSFAVVGVAETITRAERVAEDAISTVADAGLHVRHDIGKPEVVMARIEHMNEIRGSRGQSD